MYSVERRNSNTELWLKVNDTTAGLLGKTLTWNGGSAEWNQTSTGLWTGGATQYLTGDHVNFTGGGDDIVTFTNNGVAPASVTVNNTGAFHFDNSGTGNGPGITGDTGVVKEGTGSLTIAGTHSYKGTTDIKQGIVIVTGDLRRADGKIFVRSGAILGGKGHIGGEVQVAGGGCLSLLGNLPGVAGPDTNYTLSFSNNVIIAPGAAIVLNIKGNNATGYEHDVLNFTNAGANKLTLTGGTLYVNINYTGGVSDIPEFALSVVTGAILNYDDVKSLNIVPCMIGGNGTSVSLLLDINGVLRAGEAVPEPSTYGLLSGLVALGYIIWRRRKKKQPSAPPTTNQQPNAQREAP
jgi:autotransporter-associated beta strand protein